MIERLCIPWVMRMWKIISKCRSWSFVLVTYRLITAFLLIRVNCDKIIHACWDFDASSAWTRGVSALDKHQNWSNSALFCHNSRAESKYAVINLIHTQHINKLIVFFIYYVINEFYILCDKWDIFVSLKRLKYYQYDSITRATKCVSTTWGVRSYLECNHTKKCRRADITYFGYRHIRLATACAECMLVYELVITN